MLLSAVLTLLAHALSLSLSLSPLRFVDNEVVDENLSGFPQGANKGTNGRRVLLSMADTVAQTISLDESVVNEDMNLAPEKNDTAHNVTEIANGTIALEE